MQPAPLAPLALALASPALRLAIAAATLFATWAVARFLAVGIAHHRRQAEHDQAPPAEAEIEAWRRAVRRQLHTRWVGPLSPWAALRQQVPMVRPVLTGVAGAVGLWLLATLAAAGPLRQWAVQTVAAARGRVPRDYPAFLDELVAAGVLHRSGAGYRFRHPSLADHLTGQASASAPGRPHDAFDRAPPPVAV